MINQSPPNPQSAGQPAPQGKKDDDKKGTPQAPEKNITNKKLIDLYEKYEIDENEPEQLKMMKKIYNQIIGLSKQLNEWAGNKAKNISSGLAEKLKKKIQETQEAWAKLNPSQGQQEEEEEKEEDKKKQEKKEEKKDEKKKEDKNQQKQEQSNKNDASQAKADSPVQMTPVNNSSAPPVNSQSANDQDFNKYQQGVNQANQSNQPSQQANTPQQSPQPSGTTPTPK